jgi:hypothetical protein
MTRLAAVVVMIGITIAAAGCGGGDGSGMSLRDDGTDVSFLCRAAFAHLADIDKGGDDPLEAMAAAQASTLRWCQTKAEWTAAAKKYEGGDLFLPGANWDAVFSAYCHGNETSPACEAE